MLNGAKFSPRSILTLHIFFPEYDCTNLPAIYYGYEIRGCPAAIYSNGNPSRDYCQDKSWWKACCKWNGSQCIPKDESIHQFGMLIFFSYD